MGDIGPTFVMLALTSEQQKAIELLFSMNKWQLHVKAIAAETVVELKKCGFEHILPDTTVQTTPQTTTKVTQPTTKVRKFLMKHLKPSPEHSSDKTIEENTISTEGNIIHDSRGVTLDKNDRVMLPNTSRKMKDDCSLDGASAIPSKISDETLHLSDSPEKPSSDVGMNRRRVIGSSTVKVKHSVVNKDTTVTVKDEPVTKRSRRTPFRYGHDTHLEDDTTDNVNETTDDEHDYKERKKSQKGRLKKKSTGRVQNVTKDPIKSRKRGNLQRPNTRNTRQSLNVKTEIKEELGEEITGSEVMMDGNTNIVKETSESENAEGDFGDDDENEKQEKQKLPCRYCDQTLANNFALRMHMQKFHESLLPSYECRDCSAQFDTKEELVIHRRKENHTKQIPLWKGVPFLDDIDMEVKKLCIICNKYYSGKRTLRRHCFEKHRELMPMYECKVCNKEYYTRDELREHKRVEKHGCFTYMYQSQLCNLCGKTLKTLMSFKEHQLTCAERDQRKFSCDECGARFRTKSNCQNHKRHVHVDRPMTCEVCGQMCKNPRSLMEHKKRHDDSNRRHRCEECGKAFFNRNLLTAHMRTHTKEKPFKCSFCSYSCAIKQNLSKHAKKRHKHLSEQECKDYGIIMKSIVSESTTDQYCNEDTDKIDTDIIKDKGMNDNLTEGVTANRTDIDQENRKTELAKEALMELQATPIHGISNTWYQTPVSEDPIRTQNTFTYSNTASTNHMQNSVQPGCEQSNSFSSNAEPAYRIVQMGVDPNTGALYQPRLQVPETVPTAVSVVPVQFPTTDNIHTAIKIVDHIMQKSNNISTTVSDNVSADVNLYEPRINEVQNVPSSIHESKLRAALIQEPRFKIVEDEPLGMKELAEGLDIQPTRFQIVENVPSSGHGNIVTNQHTIQQHRFNILDGQMNQMFLTPTTKTIQTEISVQVQGNVPNNSDIHHSKMHISKIVPPGGEPVISMHRTQYQQLENVPTAISGPSTNGPTVISGPNTHVPTVISGSSTHAPPVISEPSTHVPTVFSGPSTHVPTVFSGPSTHVSSAISVPGTRYHTQENVPTPTGISLHHNIYHPPENVPITVEGNMPAIVQENTLTSASVQYSNHQTSNIAKRSEHDQLHHKEHVPEHIPTNINMYQSQQLTCDISKNYNQQDFNEPQQKTELDLRVHNRELHSYVSSEFEIQQSSSGSAIFSASLINPVTSVDITTSSDTSPIYADLQRMENQ